MTPTSDEIVRALRAACGGCNPTPCCEFEALGPATADLIERLTAQLADAYMGGVKKAIYEIMKEADIPGSNEISNSGDSDDGMCAQVAKRIIDQLAEAQRREQAAVEDIYLLESCDVCTHYDSQNNGCTRPLEPSGTCFEWRGPQEAGEGAAE